MNCLVDNICNYEHTYNHDHNHVFSSEHISNNHINNSSKNILEPFRLVLNDLIINHNDWRFVSISDNTIVVNRLFYELDEISIRYNNSQIHFSLPIPNSVYSYYKRFTYTDANADANTDAGANANAALQFLQSYISYFLSYNSM
jgi:hypothetical protein